MEVVRICADNPGPFTLEGSNAYVTGGWVIDPGPALDPHLDAVAEEVRRQGGLLGVLLTHDHADHAAGVGGLLERTGGAPVAAAQGDVDVLLEDRTLHGPFEAIATPGHSPDHLAFALGDVLFTGDAVLGRGSVFVWPSPGALTGYLAGLQRLRARGAAVLHPGHGPVVDDPETKIDEYLRHRHEREEALLGALALGRRTVEELLDEAWADVPDPLRPAAVVTLAAHLDKLEEEGRLPSGVERPEVPGAG